MKFTLFTILAAFSSTALAHGGVTSYLIDGKNYTGCVRLLAASFHANVSPRYIWYEPEAGQRDLIQRTWDHNPLSDPSSGNITCNNKGNTVPGSYHASVAAGGTIRTTWKSADTGFGWVHTLGPVVAYMAACGDDCTTITDTGNLKWFKIAEEGLRDGYAVGELDGWFQNDLWETGVQTTGT